MPVPVMLSQPYRPFFPLTALFAAASVLAWLAGLSAMLPLPPQPTLWHAHEMLFGFAAAIIAGFVMTAAGNWTGLRVVSPAALAVLTGLWLAARMAGLMPYATAHAIAPLIDALFMPSLALVMTRVLLQARNRRNYMFIPFLWGLALVNIVFHVALQAGRAELARLLITLSVYLVGFLMVFMGGRVIPFFTGRRCNYTPAQWPWLNWLSTLAALVAALALTFQPVPAFSAFAAAAAGSATLLRLLLWQPWRTWRIPLLWILHAGYAWLAIAWLLAAAVRVDWLAARTLPLHALMTGALGCLGLGMMTRVALGHSGRALETSPPMLAAFVLVILAGLARVASYLPGPLSGLPGLTYAAVFWSLAFLLYAACFVPALWWRAPQAPAAGGVQGK
jgi:uncharacterized protein involved in response to NO